MSAPASAAPLDPARRARRTALGASLLALCAALGCGERGAREEAPHLIGTAVDALTGEVLGGVRIQGPDGSRAVSKPSGRFELPGLELGTRGSVVGTLEDGRRAERAVGPLEPGRLEIVLRLARP